jgi:hypothetical protein
MSFREKHLWISIVASLGVWGFYFWSLGSWIADGALTRPGLVIQAGELFAVCVIAVAVIEVVLTFVAQATTSKIDKTTRDEREIGAALRASHVSLMVLIALVFCLAIAVYFAGLIGGNLVEGRGAYITDINVMVLLACVVVSETIRSGLTLALLRGLR